MTSLHDLLSGFSVFLLGFGASVVASVGTGLGALPVFAVPRASQRLQDVLMSVASGIMLAAAILSLVLPGLGFAAQRTGSQLLGTGIIGLSILAGAAAVLLVHRNAPHEHIFTGPKGPATRGLRRTWLIVIAMTLHNFPEGMAVGVGFGGGDVGNGLTIGSAILLQNVPEGFVVALGLLSAGYARPFAVLVAFLTGLVEPLGGLFGAAAVSLAASSLPWAMGFAGGAMLFVVSHEIVPETHRGGFEVEATFGLLSGFVLMLFLNGLLS